MAINHLRVNLVATITISVIVATSAFQWHHPQRVSLPFAANSKRAPSISTPTPKLRRARCANDPLFQSSHNNADYDDSTPPNNKSNTNNPSSAQGKCNDIFLLSMDGTLASSSSSRSFLSICAALKVWPSLKSPMETLGINPADFDWDKLMDSCRGSGTDGDRRDSNYGEDESYSWLIQKLDALSSIAHHGNDLDTMLGIDSVLLTRVLIEEQLLDGGRSNGRGGKYGGKFHPSSSERNDLDDATTSGGGSRSTVGSRPLTVGEVYANWHELKHVTRTKYPVIVENKKKDPLPHIRQVLTDIFSQINLLSEQGESIRKQSQNTILPTWYPLVYDAIFDYQNDMSVRQNSIILLGHEAQIPWAIVSLSMLGCSLDIESDLEGGSECVGENTAQTIDIETDASRLKVIVTTSDKAWKHHMQRESRQKDDTTECSTQSDEEECGNPSIVMVVPNTRNDESHSNMIARVVIDANAESAGSDIKKNIYVVHSSLEVLKQCKSFLGEDVPLLSQGIRKCVLPTTNARSAPATTITLFLPEWANIHPEQYNDAEMDPWLNVASEEQLLELISAKIVLSPLLEVGSE